MINKEAGVKSNLEIIIVFISLLIIILAMGSIIIYYKDELSGFLKELSASNGYI